MSGKLHEILPPDIYQVLADTRLAASASHRLRRNSLMIADVPGEYAKAPEVSLEFMSMVLVPDVIRIHEHQIAARRGLDALTEDLLGNGGTANPLEKAWRFAFHGWGIFWICSGVAKISQGRKPEPTEIAECLLQTWERILWPKIVALEPYDIELELLACDDAAKTAADRRKQRLLLNENKSTDE
ncbi:MAG: hypothetical protein O3B86_18180, partial [Planctomycetota bacterium]|nr:hypothetical protein [Planctomycetota bacterium]